MHLQIETSINPLETLVLHGLAQSFHRLHFASRSRHEKPDIHVGANSRKGQCLYRLPPGANQSPAPRLFR